MRLYTMQGFWMAGRTTEQMDGMCEGKAAEEHDVHPGHQLSVVVKA